MSERTLKEIALDLSRKYEEAQETVIWEYSGSIDADIKKLKAEVLSIRQEIEEETAQSAQPKITLKDIKKYCENRCLVILTSEFYNEMKSRWSSAQPEIIQCKDCKHYPVGGDQYEHTLKFPDERCPCYCEDKWYSWRPGDNWFCANGERKEE